MAASSDAFKSFKSAGPVVFIDSKKEASSLPLEAARLMQESHMGNTIPMVMVTTADLSKGLKGFSYETLSSDAGRAARELRRELKEKNVTGSAKATTTSEESEDQDLLAIEQTWTNSDGVAIVAAVLSVKDGEVIFLMPNGKSVGYPITKLSAASRETIEGLQ